MYIFVWKSGCGVLGSQRMYMYDDYECMMNSEDPEQIVLSGFPLSPNVKRSYLLLLVHTVRNCTL